MDITGKTIAKVTEMKKPEYDDTGWLKLDFMDGTYCVIVAELGEHTGKSEDEYPTRIKISDNVEELVPSGANANLPQRQQDSSAPPCSRIVVTLEVTDPETVEAYADVTDELIYEDIRHGSLMQKAEFVSRENAGLPDHYE